MPYDPQTAVVDIGKLSCLTSRPLFKVSQTIHTCHKKSPSVSHPALMQKIGPLLLENDLLITTSHPRLNVDRRVEQEGRARLLWHDADVGGASV